jgi:hypothetical protein
MPFMPGQAMPNVMGDYLEKGAKAVIDMQEELRNQAFKLFSGFPYASGATPGVRPEAPAPEPPEEPKPRPATRKHRGRTK